MGLGAAPGRFSFGPFLLDTLDRRLSSGGRTVELNNRYFDALVLLVQAKGALVPKERFLEEAWKGVPVTDEALTQCVRTLRRQLGDSASDPRFIETVPKHGYRFIATVEEGPGATDAPAGAYEPSASTTGWLPMIGGALGGAIAGLAGGLAYGFAAALQPAGAGMGTLSVLLVLTAIGALLGLVGGAGVGAGIAASARLPLPPGIARIGGGAAGGFLVGAIVKLVGLDAFTLLFGRSPGNITGALEGLALGAAVGLGLGLAGTADDRGTIGRATARAGLAGGVAGLGIALAGGRLLAGSLALLAASFPDGRLRLDGIAALFGESGFGPLSLALSATLEGALFAACVTLAILAARRPSAARA